MLPGVDQLAASHSHTSFLALGSILLAQAGAAPSGTVAFNPFAALAAFGSFMGGTAALASFSLMLIREIRGNKPR